MVKVRTQFSSLLIMIIFSVFSPQEMWFLTIIYLFSFQLLLQFDALKGTLRHFSLIPSGGGGILAHTVAHIASSIKVTWMIVVLHVDYVHPNRHQDFSSACAYIKLSIHKSMHWGCALIRLVIYLFILALRWEKIINLEMALSLSLAK